MLQFLIGYLQDLVYEVDAWIFQTLIEYLEGWPYLSRSRVFHWTVEVFVPSF